MTTFQGAWALVRGEFYGDRLKLLRSLLFAIIFMGYMAVLTAVIGEDTISGEGGGMLVDFMLLMMLPMLGMTFSKRTMKYIHEDSYTRMLGYMRCLPVSNEMILCRRKLHAAYSFFQNGILYFGLIYAVSGSVRSEVQLLEFAVFALTAIGLGLIISGMYIFIELTVSGKVYFFLLLLNFVLALGISLLIHLSDGNLFLYLIEFSKDWGLRSPLMWGSLVAGTASVQLFSQLTLRRLKSRNLV
ncbi:hypothetical protein [Paenibacillus sp. NFR01]|uniref:hypothetical protein n=1 Tax=Paenibacillus sp. NFR01 TaxID=1566279 RepID=UPI0008C242B1|nr:hypothetical protein [Paenibacillus sp. NFR01]SEU29687.1 hypothetical protein SAMN03159358_4818 [Paenibacillus sp. NFR01]